MKNHFISEFYFRPWVDATKHLVQFSRTPSGQVVTKQKTPGQICYQRDLHTLIGDVPETRRHVVENWLKNSIDDKAAPAVRMLLDQGLAVVGEQGAHAIVGFILSLIVRRPENVAYLRERAPMGWEAAMEREEAKMRQEFQGAVDFDALPTLREYAATRHPGAVENSGNFFITAITADERYWQRLFDLFWWVADFTGTDVQYQPTTDRAVTVTGTGLDDPNVAVILPLSPQKVLYLTTKDVRDRSQELGLGQLGLATMRLTIGNARQFVYGAAATNANMVDRYLRRS